MSRERWSRRDPDYRAGHRIGRVAAGKPPRSGCWPLWLLPVCVALAWAGGWAIGGWST